VALDGCALNATASALFTPGQAFAIITGATSVSGTFAGLAEGAVTNIGGQPFKISYAGGAVTLTAQAQPPPSDLAAAIVDMTAPAADLTLLPEPPDLTLEPADLASGINGVSGGGGGHCDAVGGAAARLGALEWAALALLAAAFARRRRS